MTVGELIEHLNTFDYATLVVRGDNSGGYEAIHRPRKEDGVQELLVGGMQRVTAIIVE